MIVVEPREDRFEGVETSIEAAHDFGVGRVVFNLHALGCGLVGFVCVWEDETYALVVLDMGIGVVDRLARCGGCG